MSSSALFWGRLTAGRVWRPLLGPSLGQHTMHLVYRSTSLTDNTLEQVIDIENEHTGQTYRFEGHRARPEEDFQVRVDQALQEDLYQLAARIAPHSKRPGDVFIRQDGQADYEVFFLVPACDKPYALNCVLTFFGQAVGR